VDDIDELNYMLTIRNIKKLESIFCHNRGLREITEIQSKSGEHYYSFLFGPIGNGEDWNKTIEVRLSRDANGDGGYRIFVMGLQLVTENNILLKDIKTKDGLAWEITTVLAKAKTWWETKG
jgi:hypothetical protein